MSDESTRPSDVPLEKRTCEECGETYVHDPLAGFPPKRCDECEGEALETRLNEGTNE